MAKKYIKTVELAQLTGRPYNEIPSLVNTGVLPGYKTHRGRWLIIINENHYREVVERICAAKSSIRMMTANFKRFRLKPTDHQGQDYNDGTPFVKALMDKALEGGERNHAKVVIVDDRLAYVGSANVTPAGLGQGIFTPGNFEAGILTENPEIVSSVKALFSMIWDGGCCTDCHRAGQCSAHDDED